MTEVCFVLAPGQNHFFVEVAEAMRSELEWLGVPAEVSREGFPPPRDGLVYVLVPPHEFAGLAPPGHWPTNGQLRRTLLYCFEQPGTKFFDGDLDLARGAVGAVLDVNELGVEEFRRNGVVAHHAPLGWTRAWTFADPTETGPEGDARHTRDIDILHMGGYSPRRGEVLSAAADRLERRRTALVLGDDSAPNSIAGDNFVIGAEKWDLLARSRVLLNIHSGERPYFEWLRVAQAICNGVFVVSEHSTGTEPLRTGTDFAAGASDELVAVAEAYLDDEERRAAGARAAFERLRDGLPLTASAQLLADVAQEVGARTSTVGAADERVSWPDNVGIRAEVEAATAAASLRNAFPWRTPPPGRDTFARRATARRLTARRDAVYPEFDWWRGWEDLDQIQSPAAVFARPVGLASLGRGSYFTEPYVIRSPDRVHVGHSVKVAERADIGTGDVGQGAIWIGDGCMIGADFHVRCSHPVEIGDRVGISARVAIGDLGAELHPELMRAEDGDLAVRIHAGAIIGIGAILMPGVTIGERAAVGAGSVVVADVPARAVVFGNPARVVGRWDGVTGRWVPGAVASAR